MGNGASLTTHDVTKVEYNILVRTGDRKQAGATKAAVYVQLYGEGGVSDELRLHHETKEDFTIGHVDLHKVICPNFGKLWKIELWKVDKDPSKVTHWFVDRVEIRAEPVKLKKKKPHLPVKGGQEMNINEIQQDDGKEEEENFLKRLSRSSFTTEEGPNFQRERSRSDPGINVNDSEKVPLDQSLRKKKMNKAVTKFLDKGPDFTFPAYRWITTREEIWEGTSVLPHNESDKDRISHRRAEIERKRGIYQWRVLPGFPSYIRSKFMALPLNEKWTEEKLGDFMGSRAKAGFNFALDKVLEHFHNWSDFDDYKDLYHLLPVPKLQKTWRLDETFGNLRIQGVNPIMIKRVTQLPIPKFGVTDAMVGKRLRKGGTLQSEMEANRLYYVEYTEFAEYNETHFKPDRYLASPICLLYVNDQKKLMPIAIQLRTDIPYSVTNNPIFTPDDPEPEWLMAKMFVSNADAVSHQIATHLLFTHLVSEPFIVATHRNLATCHPIYKMLLPHFKFQLAINCRAREVLLAPNGPVDMVMPLKIEHIMGHVTKRFKSWRFDRSDLPSSLKDRNIPLNENELPGYYLRDDGLQIWEALKTFVYDTLSTYYKTDQDVASDEELQNWVTEMYEVAFQNEDKGFPKKLTTFGDLVQVLTTLIWTVSANHASVNFLQYENFGFTPANPGSLFIAPFGFPGSKWVKRGQLTFQDIFNGLPPKEICAKQISVAYILSQFSSEDYTLGKYPETYFTDPKDAEALLKFNKTLSVIADKIEKRGNYKELLPSRIPNSTAV